MASFIDLIDRCQAKTSTTTSRDWRRGTSLNAPSTLAQITMSRRTNAPENSRRGLLTNCIYSAAYCRRVRLLWVYLSDGCRRDCPLYVLQPVINLIVIYPWEGRVELIPVIIWRRRFSATTSLTQLSHFLRYCWNRWNQANHSYEVLGCITCMFFRPIILKSTLLWAVMKHQNKCPLVFSLVLENKSYGVMMAKQISALYFESICVAIFRIKSQRLMLQLHWYVNPRIMCA